MLVWSMELQLQAEMRVDVETKARMLVEVKTMA
jgi:hypothetical protein